MIHIHYFSVVDFKRYMKSLGFVSFDYNRFDMTMERLINSDMAIISIGNPNEINRVDNDVDIWANGENNHWLPNLENVLNIEFGDVDNSGPMKYRTALTHEQAKTIAEFILRNRNKQKFIIHCGAGISRSGGIVHAISDILTKYDIEHEIHPGIPTTPNYWVKKLVLDELNEKWEA